MGAPEEARNIIGPALLVAKRGKIMQFDGTGSTLLITNVPVAVSSGGSSSALSDRTSFRLRTWLPDSVQPEAEPVLPAKLEDIERLLTTHFDRLDSVYRRLS